MHTARLFLLSLFLITTFIPPSFDPDTKLAILANRHYIFNNCNCYNYNYWNGIVLPNTLQMFIGFGSKLILPPGIADENPTGYCIVGWWKTWQFSPLLDNNRENSGLRKTIVHFLIVCIFPTWEGDGGGGRRVENYVGRAWRFSIISLPLSWKWLFHRSHNHWFLAFRQSASTIY